MANDPQTYSELLAAVSRWLKDTSLDDNIPEFVALAERRFNRILNTPEMESLTTLTAAATVALPSDFWEVRSVYLDTDPRRPLEEVTQGVLRSRYAAQTTGTPEVYAISGLSMILGPSPDSSDSLVLTYKSTIPALSDTNTTNWLLTAHPDIYLWATLLMAQAFGFDDERLPVWKAALDEALGELEMASNRKRYTGPMRMRSPVSWNC